MPQMKLQHCGTGLAHHGPGFFKSAQLTQRFDFHQKFDRLRFIEQEYQRFQIGSCPRTWLEGVVRSLHMRGWLQYAERSIGLPPSLKPQISQPVRRVAKLLVDGIELLL